MYTPNRGYPVIVQNRDALEAIAGMTRATGSITFTANAADTKVLSLYGSTFEFLTDVADVTEGNIAVEIGEDAEQTRDNLAAAIAGIPQVQSGTATVTVETSGTDTLNLSYYDVGTAGNSEITCDDSNITVAGMSGGADGGTINVSVAESAPIMRMASFTVAASGEVAITVPSDLATVSSMNIAATPDGTNNAAGCIVGHEDDVDSGLGIYIASSNYEGKPVKANPTDWKITGAEGDIIVIAFFGTGA